MKIMVFTEGTIIMHSGGLGHTREEIVSQVAEEEASLFDWPAYVPIGNAAEKLGTWQRQGAKILYLTSRTTPDEVGSISAVLKNYHFPAGELLFRREGQQYKDVAERVIPDVLIEDDCESIGGVDEMTSTHINPIIRKKIKSIPVKEFGGIDYLSDSIEDLIGLNIS